MRVCLGVSRIGECRPWYREDAGEVSRCDTLSNSHTQGRLLEVACVQVSVDRWHTAPQVVVVPAIVSFLPRIRNTTYCQPLCDFEVQLVDMRYSVVQNVHSLRRRDISLQASPSACSGASQLGSIPAVLCTQIDPL